MDLIMDVLARDFRQVLSHFFALPLAQLLREWAVRRAIRIEE